MGFRYRWGILVLSSFLLVTLFSTFYVTYGFPSISGDCSVCHDDQTGMTITASSIHFEQNKGETFTLNISATGIVGKFPNDLVNNSEFSYYGLDAEGTVVDGESNDLESGIEQLLIQYLVTVPEVGGEYTLRFFAVKHTPYSISIDISVTVIDSAVSPSTTDTTTSSPTSSNPTPPTSSIPWINLLPIFNMNFLFSWGFLLVLTFGLTAVLSRGKPKPPLLFVGILIATFGWASYYTFGIDPLSATLGLGGFLIAAYAERKVRLKTEVKNG